MANCKHRCTYVYGLVSSLDGTMRYVGKTVEPDRRLHVHLLDRSHSYKVHWIQDVLSKGGTVTLKVLQRVRSNGICTERKWIKLLKEKGERLTNLTSGGDGATGIRFSEATREKMRQSATGRVHAPRTLARMRASRANWTTDQRERVYTQEMRTQMSFRNMGINWSEAQLEAVKASNRRRAKCQQL